MWYLKNSPINKRIHSIIYQTTDVVMNVTGYFLRAVTLRSYTTSADFVYITFCNSGNPEAKRENTKIT